MNRLLHYLLILLLLSCHTKTDKQQQEALTTADSTQIETKIESKQLYTLLNSDDYLILGDKLAKVKVVQENEIEEFPSFDILIGYENDVIIGENITDDNVEIYKKYHPTTSFEAHAVALYEGTLAEPDFSTYPDAQRFKTRIKKECANGINFAGHYTIVTWGCGSPCQSGVVVDRKTGRIFGGVDTSLGSEFRKDSRLIIKNVEAIDKTKNRIKVCAYCVVYHQVWTGSEFKEID